MLNTVRKAGQFYRTAAIVIDLLIINIAIIGAFLIKFKFNIPERNFIPYIKASPFITIAAFVFIDIYGLANLYRKSVYDMISSILFVVLLLGVTTGAITYMVQGYAFPRSVLLIAPIVQFTFLSIWKIFLLKIRRFLIGTKEIMVVGDADNLDAIIDKIKLSAKSEKISIKYTFKIDEIKQINRCIEKIDEVFICGDVPNNQKADIVSRCLGSRRVIHVIPQAFEISLVKSKLTQFDDIPVFTIDKLDLTFEQKLVKRLMDIVLALIGTVLTSPIMLIAALVVKLTSHGPAIYKQKRITQDGRIFKIFKFRTMYLDVESATGPVISGTDDPRVTGVGHVLRKFKIDELSQLFNVLKGDMSIVGPRPERPYFVEQFTRDIPEYEYRTVVKAGITGFAQVLGKYDTSPEDKLRYDLMYIKNYSILLDIKLILQTLKIALTGKNNPEKSFGSLLGYAKSNNNVLNT